MPDAIAPGELKRLLDSPSPPLVIDVREPEEYAEWRIPGSKNVPLAEIECGVRERRIEDPVVTVCARGRRSETAARVLALSGIEARSLEGGMQAWGRLVEIVPIVGDPASTNIVQFRRVGKGCLSYLVFSAGEGLVIDPGLDVEPYVAAAHDRGVAIVGVLDTHAHADHASGARELAARTGATYRAPAEADPDGALDDGAAVPFGADELRVHAAPGHTPGSLVYTVAGAAFTGDTLFVDGVGRPDLGQDAAEHAPVLFRTLRRLLATLPGETRILPAHFGEDALPRSEEPVEARLRDVRERVAPLSFGEEAFVAWVLENRAPAPDNFRKLKAHNRGEDRIEDGERLADLESGPNRCAVSASA